MDTKFQHKSLPITLGYSEYSKLSTAEKNNFVIVNPEENKTTVIHNTTTNQKTDDLLGLGKVTETVAGVALLPFAILGFLD